MFTIDSTERMRDAYILLHTLAEEPAAPEHKASREILIATVKKAIREYSHKVSDYRIIVKDYGIDGYVELYRFPEELDHMSKDDAEEWFDSNRREHYIPSPYDCTGQKFTNWRKLVHRQGHWYAYHSVSIDV